MLPVSVDAVTAMPAGHRDGEIDVALARPANREQRAVIEIPAPLLVTSTVGRTRP